MEKELKTFFENKTVLILGFGREGQSTYAFLQKNVPSCTVTVADKNVCTLPDGSPLPCATQFGDNYLDNLDVYDIIMKTPGIALIDNVSDAVKQKITSQTDLFMRFHVGKVIGITGTKGKSTTSSLIHHLLTACGADSHLVGNIGVPVFSCLDELGASSVAVYELSCHQLEYVQASPDIAVLLNVYEDHLDHYASFDAYREAKYNIFRYMTPSDTLIVGLGCENIDYDRIRRGVFRKIFVDPALSEKVDTKLCGRHNLYNIECAMTVGALCGCNRADMLDAVSSFEPLEHRLEKVGTFDGVTYYNDSISTIPEATVSAVNSLQNVSTLLIGGMDRGIDYGKLISFIREGRVQNVVCMYESGKRIYDDLTRLGYSSGLYYENDLESAFLRAKSLTKTGAVVLSPAAASYGYFKNFEERGRAFKKLCKGL